MARIQECFKIEAELKRLAIRQGREESISRGAIYRKALIEYLRKTNPKIMENWDKAIATAMQKI